MLAVSIRVIKILFLIFCLRCWPSRAQIFTNGEPISKVFDFNNNKLGLFDALPFQTNHDITEPKMESSAREGSHMLEVPLYFLMPDNLVHQEKNTHHDVNAAYGVVNHGGHLNNPVIPNNFGQNRVKADENDNHYSLLTPMAEDRQGVQPEAQSSYNPFEMVVSQRKHARIAPYYSPVPQSRDMYSSYYENKPTQYSGSFLHQDMRNYIPTSSYHSDPHNIQIYPVPTPTSFSENGRGHGGHHTSMSSPQINAQHTDKNTYHLQQQPFISYDLSSGQYQQPSHSAALYKLPMMPHNTVNRIHHHLKHLTQPSSNQILQTESNNLQFHRKPTSFVQSMPTTSAEPSSSTSSSTKMQNLLGTLINILKNQQPSRQVVHHVPVPVPMMPPHHRSLGRSSKRRNHHHPALANFYGKMLSRKGRRFRRRGRRRGRNPMYKRLLRAYKSSRGDEGSDDIDDIDGIDDIGESSISVLGEHVDDNDIFDIEIQEDGESEFAMETSDNNYSDYDEDYTK